MPDAVFRRYWEPPIELNLDEIADRNCDMTGWKPDRANVSRHAKALGLPPRRIRHTELIPWRVRPEHKDHWMRLGLQAEAMRREGRQLSRSQKAALKVLRDVLDGPRLLAVSYDSARGFHLTDRLSDDPDAIVIRDDPDSKSPRDIKAQ